MRKTFTMGGVYGARNYTVRELLDLKGKQKFTQITASSTEEAIAALAANIDIIDVDINETASAIRSAAPNIFAIYGLSITKHFTEDKALRAAMGAMEAGADAIFCGVSLRIVSALAEVGIPVVGHIGLVPRKSTWTGGLRAVGKTADQALQVYRDLKAYEAAGAFAVEVEVVPHQVMTELSKRTAMLTISLGSGGSGDVQFLFAQDIFGECEGPIPRHAKKYRDFYSINQELQQERTAALKEFREEATTGVFPGPEHLVEIHSVEFERFQANLEAS